ncbi:MAG: hypothetical protein SGCHY_002677 [Lobulomycetales sp.]
MFVRGLGSMATAAGTKRLGSTAVKAGPVAMRLQLNALHQRVLRVPLEKGSVVIPLTARLPGMCDLLLAFRHELQAPEAGYITPAPLEKALHHSRAGDVYDLLDGRILIKTNTASYVVDQGSVARLKADTEMALERELERAKQPGLLESIVSRRAQMRVLVSRYGILSYLALEIAALAFLTIEVGWDIVEPITLMIAYTTSILAFGYSVFCRENFSLPNFEGAVRQRYKRKLERKLGHDSVAFAEMKARIERLRGELVFLENLDAE